MNTTNFSDEELKNKLTQEEFQVLREKSTERPFSGEYVLTKTKGLYACKVCETELFLSDTKFDSGTGWPSFDQAIPGRVNYSEDHSHGIIRTEVSCATCGSHLGHVFEDGPKTTGKRYCINSICLKFTENKVK